GFLAAGLDHQVGAVAVELVDLAADDLGVDRDLGRLHPPLGHLQGGVALAAAGGLQRLQGLAGLQALEIGEVVARGVRVDGAQALGQAVHVRIPAALLGQGRCAQGGERKAKGQCGVLDVHRSTPSCSRRRETWARRWASSVLATASRLRTRARSAAAAAATAAVRASRALPEAMADWAWDSRPRARSRSALAYWSASASAARATACCAADSSAVGGGVLAQAVRASTIPSADTCRIRCNCAMLGCIGGRIFIGEQAAIVGSAAPDRNDRVRTKGGLFMDIGYFLKLMTDKNASDMFLTTGAPVHIKVEGQLHPLGNTSLPAGMVKKIAYSLMDEGQVPVFERDLELNMALSLKDSGRFRVNVFKQRGEIGMVIRAIRSVIPSIEELQLPQVLKDIIMAPRGLVLIVGSTGSGKSTTLASMIDYRNSNVAGHILTIEDPIEYLHTHKKSIVNQREVGLDTHSFRNALKNAMREAPDVILIGEILDSETMEAAISFAETGHICLATLHSNNADQTIERILNFFPEAAHKNVLMNLAL